MTMPYSRFDAIEAEGYAGKPGIPILARDKTYVEIWLSEDSTHPLRFSHEAMDEFADTIMRIINPEELDGLEIDWNRNYGEFRYRWEWSGSGLFTSSPAHEKITIGTFIEYVIEMLIVYKTDEFTDEKEKGTHPICEVVKHFGEEIAGEDYGMRLYRDLLNYYVDKYPGDKAPQDDDYWYELERGIARTYNEQRHGVEIINDETYPLPDSDKGPVSDQEILLKCCLVWPEFFFNINGAGYWSRDTLRDSDSLLFESGLINHKKHVCEQGNFRERRFLWESKTKLKSPHAHMIECPDGDGSPFTISSSRAVVTISTCRCGKSKLEAFTWSHSQPTLLLFVEIQSEKEKERALEKCVSKIVNTEMPLHPKESDLIARYLLSKNTSLLPMSNTERARKHRLGKTIEKIRNVEIYQKDLGPVFEILRKADWKNNRYDFTVDKRQIQRQDSMGDWFD